VLDRRGISVLAFGHLAVDTCQGAVPALLPFLIADRGLSYSQASALILAATVSSSIVQPAFGLLADRRAIPWAMPVALAIAGAGIAAVGLVDSYALIFALIVVSGVGVAAFHPEGSRYTHYVSGAQPGRAMSFFSVGGNAGFALGPILVTPLVLVFGLEGTLALVVLPGLAAVLITGEIARLERFRAAPASHHGAAEAVNHWGAFARLGGAVSLRSVVFFGLTTFIPLYFIDELGTSTAAANGALIAMLVGGMAGTLIGGRIADHTSPRTVFAASLAFVAPLVVVFLLAGPLLATIVAAPSSMATIATFSVAVVLGQALLPGHLGLASGFTLGLSIGVGGIAAAALGALADATSLRTVIEVTAFAALGAVALALSLPGGRRREPAAERVVAPAEARV